MMMMMMMMMISLTYGWIITGESKGSPTRARGSEKAAADIDTK